MKTVTYEEFLKIYPWLEGTRAGQLKAYFNRFGGKMTALDILKLEDMHADEKLSWVLCEEFIPAPILHEFACVCAERALSRIKAPDPRSTKAIEVKRAWIRDEATDEELAVARDAARVVAEDAYVTYRAAYVDRDAPPAAVYASPDASASLYAPLAAIKLARRSAAWDVLNATYEAQVAYLLTTLEEEK